MTGGRGGPVGVPIRHASAVNVVNAMATSLAIGPADSVLVLPSTLFHASIVELLLPLTTGARIVLAPTEIADDGARLRRLISGEGVTFMNATPGRWQKLIDTGLRSTRSLRALVGGGRLTRQLADEILERCRVLWNAYGAVETGHYSTLARVERSAPVTIGRPLANTRAYVLDADGRPAPVGVTGRLLIGGDGVSPGYRGRPERNAQAFGDDPFRDGRIFRTGDLARWHPDGSLELERAQNRSG